MEEKRIPEELLKNHPINPLAELENLSDEEKKTVEAVSGKINVSDEMQISQYGKAAQKSIFEFSESALEKARNEGLGEVCTMISSFLAEQKGFDAGQEKKGIFGIFKRDAKKAEILRSCYEEAENRVDAIASELEKKQSDLLSDMESLEQMYAQNLDYHKMLTLYILAGKIKLRRERETTLASMQEIARRTELPQDLQSVQDMENACRRFEEKLNELSLTRLICLRMAPQIRLLQNIDAAVSGKIQNVLASSIPVWKDQMQSSFEVQSASSGNVCSESLREANEILFAELDKVLQAQREGEAKRASAEEELRLISGKLKLKKSEEQEFEE